MQHGFIVTSAINTKFGVFNTQERLQQTIDTVKSIHSHCENAYVIVVEMSGDAIAAEQKEILLSSGVNNVVDFSASPDVVSIYANSNWDIVKNATEIMCFGKALHAISDTSSSVISRWFKVSGRYLLNDDFDINRFSGSDAQGKLVFAQKLRSQFMPEVTGGVSYQYMSRLWSFPANELQYVRSMFTAMFKCFVTTVNNGGYLDIEHLLFLFADPKLVLEVDKVGVQGLLGPNGQIVKD